MALTKENPGYVSSLSVPKALIFIQRRRNLGRVGVPLVPASKTASLSRTRESRIAPLAFPYSGKKRSLPEEVDHGDSAQAQTETAQTKRVPDFRGPTPASNPIVEDHDEEAVEADEVVPQPCSSLREAQVLKTEYSPLVFSWVRGVTAETPVPTETECPLVVGEIRIEGTVPEEINLEVVIKELTPAVESTGFEGESLVPNMKYVRILAGDRDAFARRPCIPGYRELEAENIAPELTVEPTARTEAGHNLGASRAKKSGIPAMSKDKAKLMLAKWVTLSTEERVGEEQRGKKEELHDEVDQMLTALTTVKEDIDKVDVEVGMELWHEKLRKICLDKLRVDTRHFVER
ncbi:unnamed protein product [Prunus armeniaca]|uniref:Uncharacterized protein n=1 Tax=Prunus armeniaca TaxID=36596 RepID=A0A6J5WFY1_PRUAR|nr:unnamed protein product [Prunus armeniaca]CAB4298965.1 unnamed protein product [Prunus armeniaca]